MHTMKSELESKGVEELRAVGKKLSQAKRGSPRATPPWSEFVIGTTPQRLLCSLHSLTLVISFLFLNLSFVKYLLYMAGYFSNHSNQSRFLANSSASLSSTTTTTQAPAPSSTIAGPPRSRAPSSKHFSTSLATSSEEGTSSKEKQSTKIPTSVNGAAGVHPLRNTYVRNTLWRIGHYCVV